MLEYKTVKVIDVNDWDKLVSDTYGRIYNFQQQDDCKERQHVPITIPDEPYDYENDSIPEVVNGKEMGVSFKAWLERDPKQPLLDRDDKFGLQLFWERNFYPDVQMIANDLHAKGLIEAGDYKINIDW
jgi:hypothetical protein